VGTTAAAGVDTVGASEAFVWGDVALVEANQGQQQSLHGQFLVDLRQTHLKKYSIPDYFYR
jgi:hypothetical protein